MRDPVSTSSPEWSAWATFANHVSDAVQDAIFDYVGLRERSAIARTLWEAGYRPTEAQIEAMRQQQREASERLRRDRDAERGDR